jgi:hypothetical protein
MPGGLRIADCPVLISNGKAWATLPARPQLDKDGIPRRDEAGKVLDSPVLGWRTRKLAKRFSAVVVALVRQAHPGNLEGAP